ncbi:MBL fold metallo-hydrolase [Thioalkalivibrio sp. ARh3]|uniref:MBL fold metallo-hydrolase n=1 Tax=Thioalkalivibrio sp. ARh3 TaxID=1158148 RepID=UPI00035C3CA7|nr:MBL fold metallo-hydrolase [Thioalkalivibrio sp. ARh3]
MDRRLKGRWAALPVLAVVLMGLALIAQAEEENEEPRDRPIEKVLEPIQLTDRVWYFYGSLENRTPENLGFTNNTGFVVTDEGVVLIDSGPSYKVAERMAEAIAEVTDQPITHVISVGSQDHRWLGNGYFHEQGAELVALQRTAATQAERGEGQIESLANAVGEGAMEGTEPVPAPDPIDADEHTLTVGGVDFELIYAGDAHFPGDIMVHLPGEDVVFTGDIVYTERMLGIHPWSNPVEKLEAFRHLESIDPEIVVPGHGRATDMAEARQDTGDYLTLLVREVKAGIEDWESLDEVVERLADLEEFEHLRHYDDWHRPNVNRTYLFIEENM